MIQIIKIMESNTKRPRIGQLFELAKIQKGEQFILQITPSGRPELTVGLFIDEEQYDFLAACFKTRPINNAAPEVEKVKLEYSY